MIIAFNRRLIALSLLLLGSAGCIHGDIVVDAPKLTRRKHLSSREMPSRQIILARTFLDQRKYVACGIVKNGYNKVIANVRCATQPSEWLMAALANGLSGAGFQVVLDSDGGDCSTLHVEGTLLIFQIEPKLNALSYAPEADIKIELRVRSSKGLYAQRIFYVKGTSDASAGSQSAFQEAVDRATREIVSNMVDALADLAKRFDQNSNVAPKQARATAREIAVGE